MALFFSVLFFAGLYALLMEAFRAKWEALPLWETTENFVPATSVSVVVPARNEASNLARCLHSLLRQDYPAHLLEIIVVDDHSEDATAVVAEGFSGQGVRLLPAAHASKKGALRTGIEAARGQLIATVDADCEAPIRWLPAMVSYYERHRPVLLAGPVAFAGSTSFLEQFQSLDLLGMTALSASGIHGGWFHLGNGANLVYEREAFFQVGGFGGVSHLASGDDVLLMQKMAEAFPGRIAYVKSPEALVSTMPAADWPSFWAQRLRWGGKASQYREWQLTALGAVVLACSWSILLSFAAMPWAGIWPFLLGFGLKSFADYRFLSGSARFFSRAPLLSIFWQAQFMHVLYIVISGTASVFLKEYYWKGRRVR